MPAADTANTVVREVIDIASLSNPAPEDGALCVFTGVVRNHNDGKEVNAGAFSWWRWIVLATGADF